MKVRLKVKRLKADSICWTWLKAKASVFFQKVQVERQRLELKGKRVKASGFWFLPG